MNLSDAVTRFATEEFQDAFDPLVTFFGKVNPFAEVTNSGSSSQRRILETPVDAVMPSERVVKSFTGHTYLVANQNTDYWNGEEIRHKYSTLPVYIMGAVGSIGEVLGSTQPDQEVYAYPYYVRREVDEDEQSDYFAGFEILMSQVKNFSRGSILTLGSAVYRFKTDTWVDGAGFAVAQAVRLEDPFQVYDIVSADAGNYDVSTDSYASTVITDVPCFVEPLKQDYEFITPSFTDIDVGDRAISVRKVDAVILTGSNIGDYRVMSVRDVGDWVTCQCRHMS